LSANKDGNVSLTHKISSTLDEIFIFEACTYDFFMLEGLGTLRGAPGVGRGEIATEVAVGGEGGATTFEGRETKGEEEEDFSTAFSFTRLNLLYSGRIFSPMSLQIFLSSIERRSHFKEYIDAIRSQRALTMAAYSAARAFLLAGLYMK